MKRLLLLVLLWPSVAWGGAVHFVRVDGSDSNDGHSWANAWATTAKVQSTIVAGDTAIFGRGFYFSTHLDPPSGGSNTNWTVYACSTWYTGTTPAEKLAGINLAILCGGDRVTSWTVYSGSVWQASWTPTNCNANANNTNYCVTRGGLSDMEVCISNGGTIANVTAPYDWAHTSNTLYYYPPAGESDPNDDTIIAACDITLNFITANVNHVRVWGLGLRSSYAKNVLWNQDQGGTNVDSCFVEHCAISHVTSQYGGNPANVGSNSHTASIQCNYNYIRACSLSHSYELEATAGTKTRWTAMTWYHVDHVVVESCFFDATTSGPFWKDSTFNCTMRYNTMKGYPEKSWTGYYAGPNNDSCYGNTIWGTGRGLRVDQEEQLASGYLYILNNTVYDVDDYFFAQELSAVGSGTTVIKYNVFYKADGSPWIQMPNWSSGPTMVIDSNIYYDSPVSNFSASLTGCGSSRTLAQWRACGYDIHSDTVNPGFADPSGGDFSRPSASGEMSATYGGRDWTIFGAVQDEGANLCPTITQNLPTNNDSITDYTPTLDMDITDTDGDIDSVWVYFEDGDATPDNLLVDTVLTADDDLLITTTTLTENHDYYWQTIALDTAGCADTSAISKFTMDSIPAVSASATVTLQGVTLQGVKIGQ